MKRGCLQRLDLKVGNELRGMNSSGQKRLGWWAGCFLIPARNMGVDLAGGKVVGGIGGICVWD